MAQFRNSTTYTVYKVTEFPLVKTKNAKMQALKDLAKAELLQLNRAKFPSLGIFVSKQGWKSKKN